MRIDDLFFYLLFLKREIIFGKKKITFDSRAHCSRTSANIVKWNCKVNCWIQSELLQIAIFKFALLSISSRYHGIVDTIRMYWKTWWIRRGATSAKVTDLRVTRSTVTPLPVSITVPIFRFDYDRERKEINLGAILRMSSPCVVMSITYMYFVWCHKRQFKSLLIHNIEWKYEKNR